MLLLSLLPILEILESFPALNKEILGLTVHLKDLFCTLCILPVQLVKCQLGVYHWEYFMRWIMHKLIVSLVP